MSKLGDMDVLERAIQEAVRTEIETEVTKAVNEAKRRVEDRIPEIVASVSLRIMHVFSVERFQNEVLIHVRLESR